MDYEDRRKVPQKRQQMLDGRNALPKRQRMMDRGSSYYGGMPGTSFMYNAPPYANQSPPCPVIKLRSLPPDCTETYIAEYFHGLDILDIVLVHKGSHFNGEAYCLFAFPIQVDFALQRNRQETGRRYIEISRSTRHDYYEHTGILRMRGLPFSATRDNIFDFFNNFRLSKEKIHITYNSMGKPSGEAFVVFSDPDQSKAAMSKHRMYIGNRYVELFASNRLEMNEAIARGSIRRV